MEIMLDEAAVVPPSLVAALEHRCDGSVPPFLVDSVDAINAISGAPAPFASRFEELLRQVAPDIAVRRPTAPPLIAAQN